MENQLKNLKVIAKLYEARQLIKKMDLKKAGKNEYSNYEYYTPEQVDKLVSDACEKTKLLPVFELLRGESGYQGILRVIDIESGEYIEFTMPTDVPAIKATNTVQQLGGCVTYTERYLLMTAFSIKDNDLDPDSKSYTDNEDESEKSRQDSEKPILTQSKLNIYLNRIRNGEFGKGEKAFQVFMDRLNSGFRINSQFIEQIKKEFLIV